ncbi:hypothetical protein SRABI128_06143 [Microbacterium sp. Bi128]|nr:hypothetical protein SRABI128_06143 [Microbacterium sp. Bi128]
MEHHRRTIPGFGGTGLRPHCSQRGRLRVAFAVPEPFYQHSVTVRQRHASERVDRDARFGGHVKGQQEIGQAFSRRPAVCRADVGRSGSGDPPHNAPRPWKVRRRPAGMDGDRNSDRGAASYVGKVALLMQYQRNGLRPARQPDGQAVTEQEGRVVPAVRNPH